MKTRVIVAAALLPFFLAIILLCPLWTAAALVSAMSAIAVFELLYTAGLARYFRVALYSAVAAVGVVLWSYFGCGKTMGIAIVFLYFAALFGELLASGGNLPFHRLCAAAFSALVVPMLLSSLVRILAMGYGKFYILVALILAFTSDTGAYFVGCKYGKHKLAPNISPKKTVEGLLGGIASCVLFMLLYCLVLQLGFKFRVDYLSAVIYGVFGSAASVLGDLTFSVIKRQSGIKDYGKLLPGHGGILDRFDSMIVVAPLAELLLTWLPLIG